MSKITSVEPQKKNARRFNIFLDGKFAFGADEDLVVERRLVVGKEILPEDLEKIIYEAEVGKLMERMYGLFNIRDRSEKEIRDYLRRVSFKRKIKGGEEIGELAIEQLINKLKQKDLLDDEKFAKAWVESRSKKYGINRIKQELFQKGIDKEIIEEVTRVKNLESSEETAEKQLIRKIKNWKNLKPMEFRRKASEFLLRRGFEYSLIKIVVEKIIKKEYNSLRSSEEPEENYG